MQGELIKFGLLALVTDRLAGPKKDETGTGYGPYRESRGAAPILGSTWFWRRSPPRICKETWAMPTHEKARSHEARGHRTGRNDDYDAYYCATCGEWLEPRCADPSCEYCANRPEMPPGT